MKPDISFINRTRRPEYLAPLVGPVAKAWHGADVAYYVNFLVEAIIDGGYRVWRHRSAAPAAAVGTPAPTLGGSR